MNLKHNYGQYFTECDLVNKTINLTKPYLGNIHNILEPSYGDGKFLEGLKKNFLNVNIDAYEIDKEIFKPIDGVNCFLDDFLFQNNQKKYSLIIGNPPYIELAYSFYDEKTKKEFMSKYSKKGRGRVNLVHAFFDRSFELIEDGGVISFLLPSTILTSPWYNDIRKTIYEEYTIKHVTENIKFKGVSMKVCLLILKKEKSKFKNFIVKKKEVYQINNLRKNNLNGTTIKEMGFIVGVGKYCWSHYKNDLNNDGEGYKVLYSSYIDQDGISEKEIKNKNKKKYLRLIEPSIIKNAIVFPRTTSKNIKFGIIQNNEYVFENHIVYITHENNEELISIYHRIKKNLSLLEQIFNSTNLTKTEIENIILPY